MENARSVKKDRTGYTFLIASLKNVKNLCCLTEAIGKVSPFLQAWVGKPPSITLQLPGELFVIHRQELYTTAHGLPKLVAQGYNSWHDNEVTDSQRKKERFPREPAHLMHLFATGGELYQHTALCWRLSLVWHTR